jgi:hypothetical protein
VMRMGCGRSGRPLYWVQSTAQAWRVTSEGSGSLRPSGVVVAPEKVDGAERGRLPVWPLAGILKPAERGRPPAASASACLTMRPVMQCL